MSDDERVGSAAEEAVKLLGALSDWARDQTSDRGDGVAAAAAQAAHGVGDHIATDSPECRYCPVCRALHAMRETRPEVKAHLAAAASGLLQAATSLVQAAAAAAETVVPDSERSPSEQPATAEPVERIHLDDDEEGAGS